MEKGELSTDDLQTLVLEYGDYSSLLSSVAGMIGRYQTTLQTAQTQLDERQRGLGMNVLPVEVIEYIFHLACSEPRTPLHPIDKQLDTRRFSLAHVNRLWRAIALNKVELWADVVISRGTPPEYISFLLDHSKSCTLHIAVDLVHPAIKSRPCIPSDVPDHQGDELEQTHRGLILNMASRCRVLIITFTSINACDALITHMASSSLNGLEQVCLRGLSPDPYYHSIPALIHIPNLRKITSSHSLILSPDLCSVIEYISMPCVVSVALWMLETCPNLEHAALQLTSDILVLHRVLHQRLRYLEVALATGSSSSWDVLIGLLTALSLPHLEVFNIVVPLGAFWLQPPANELIKLPEFDHVREVVIDFNDCLGQLERGYQSAIRLLAAFPNLEHLQFRNFEPSTFRKVLEGATAGVVLMMLRLERLVLVRNTAHITSIREDMDAIIGLLRTDSTNQRLRTVTVIVEGFEGSVGYHT